MSELAIIVPTYPEASFLPELITRVCRATSRAGIDAELIIVDDNSQDGTQQVCERMCLQHRVNLITRRTERRLATAVCKG